MKFFEFDEKFFFCKSYTENLARHMIKVTDQKAKFSSILCSNNSNMCLGVNSTNILRAAFACKDPRSIQQCLYEFLGSAHVVKSFV